MLKDLSETTTALNTIAYEVKKIQERQKELLVELKNAVIVLDDETRDAYETAERWLAQDLIDLASDIVSDLGYEWDGIHNGELEVWLPSRC